MNREFRFTATLVKSHNRIWGAHVEVPDRVIRSFERKSPQRVVCVLNEKTKYQTALLPVGSGRHVIRVNKKLRDLLGLTIGMDVRVRLEHDKSKYGLPLPAEFKELLDQDPDGRAYFDALTMGKQRTLLHIVGSVKAPLKRAERAAVVVSHLKSIRGKINYRELYRMLGSRKS
jgi:hypothetical protein